MTRRIAASRRLFVAALAGVVLFIATGTAHAGWFWRARTAAPTTQASTTQRNGQNGTVRAQANRSYQAYPTRQATRYRSAYPRSSQDLYHNLGKWPPY